MLPNVMFVVAFRLNIKDLLVPFNLCLFPSGNGTKSVWTSSLLSENLERKQCHLCCHRPTLKSCSLPSNSRVYYCQSVSRLVHLESCITSWCFFGNQF